MCIIQRRKKLSLLLFPCFVVLPDQRPHTYVIIQVILLQTRTKTYVYPCLYVPTSLTRLMEERVKSNKLRFGHNSLRKRTAVPHGHSACIYIYTYIIRVRIINRHDAFVMFFSSPFRPLLPMKRGIFRVLHDYTIYYYLFFHSLFHFLSFSLTISLSFHLPERMYTKL